MEDTAHTSRVLVVTAGEVRRCEWNSQREERLQISPSFIPASFIVKAPVSRRSKGAAGSISHHGNRFLRTGLPGDSTPSFCHHLEIQRGNVIGWESKAGLIPLAFHTGAFECLWGQNAEDLSYKKHLWLFKQALTRLTNKCGSYSVNKAVELVCPPITVTYCSGIYALLAIKVTFYAEYTFKWISNRSQSLQTLQENHSFVFCSENISCEIQTMMS